MLVFLVAKIGICKRKKRRNEELKKGAEKAKPHYNLPVSLKTLNKNPIFKSYFCVKKKQKSSTFEGAIEFYFIFGHKTVSPVPPFSIRKSRSRSHEGDDDTESRQWAALQIDVNSRVMKGEKEIWVKKLSIYILVVI